MIRARRARTDDKEIIRLIKQELIPLSYTASPQGCPNDTRAAQTSKRRRIARLFPNQAKRAHGLISITISAASCCSTICSSSIRSTAANKSARRS